jgi:hypothetical protein
VRPLTQRYLRIPPSGGPTIRSEKRGGGQFRNALRGGFAGIEIVLNSPWRRHHRSEVSYDYLYDSYLKRSPLNT